MSDMKKGISGSTLKIIAIITMLIDHVGFALFPNLLILRMIGRIAFPIFAFTLAEGFCYTHDRKKYALRLALFALLSEIPFNLLLTGSVLDKNMWAQNVILTMLFAFLTLWAMEGAQKLSDNHLWHSLCAVVITIAGMAVAELCRTDYGAAGVLTIVVMYVLRHNRTLQIVLGCLVLGGSYGGIELFCLFAVIPLLLYSGKKGYSLKYFFYLFYPLHILIIYLIRLYFYHY